MVHCASLGILKGMKKCSFYFLWKYNVREMHNKKPFEIILHVGRVTSLQSWVAKKSCHDLNVLFLTTLPTLKAFNSPYMQYYFKRFFYFEFLGSYIFISDKKVKAKSNRNRNCIFSFPWESRGMHIGSFFMFHISVMTSPTN